MTFLTAFCVALVAAAFQVSAQTPPVGGTQAAAERPRLVVILVVDQLRGDYPDLYGNQWTGGLHEVFTKGAYFTQAAYPYSTSVTCAGHNTIGTGVLPSTHGMVGNEWFDRATRAFVTCTEDPTARSLAFGGAIGTEHHSAIWRLTPTFADELARQSRGRTRIVSMSGKARSAIGLGGKGGPNSIILWEEDAPGVFATSSALTSRPSEDVSAYVKEHPILAARGQPWDRALPAAAYRFQDKAAGEPPDGTFPHLLQEPIRTSRSTTTFGNLWDSTPFIDGFLGGLAGTLVERLNLGRPGGTDLLAISFSGLDITGHTYGPRSHEVQDTLVRLDRIVGGLIGDLDRRIGRDRYVLALSADHGVSEMPEQVQPPQTAGRIGSFLPVGTAVDAVLDAAWGPGQYVEAISGSSLYFSDGVLDRIRADVSLTKSVETAALGVRGIANVYWSADILGPEPTDDALLARVRKSFMAGRSGDLVIIQRANWPMGSSGANHGSPYGYDVHVPVVLFGARIAPGTYTTTATPVDIAPTLAALTGVTLRTDGRVLTEALTPSRK